MIDITDQLVEDQGYSRLAQAYDRPVSRVLGHRPDRTLRTVARLPLLGESPEFSLRLEADFWGLCFASPHLRAATSALMDCFPPLLRPCA